MDQRTICRRDIFDVVYGNIICRWCGIVYRVGWDGYCFYYRPYHKNYISYSNPACLLPSSLLYQIYRLDRPIKCIDLIDPSYHHYLYWQYQHINISYHASICWYWGIYSPSFPSIYYSLFDWPILYLNKHHPYIFSPKPPCSLTCIPTISITP